MTPSVPRGFDAAFKSLSRQKWPSTLTRLNERARELRRQFLEAEPFPHVVVDGLFDDELLDAVAAEFPDLRDKHWYTTTSPNGGKRYAGDLEGLAGPLTLILVQRMNAQPFIDCLEAITGIDGLISHREPSLHLSGRGDQLGIHIDGGKSGKAGLYRRLNVVLYLNKGWSESYAGDLELWNEDASACVKRIAPMNNRLAILLNTDTSYHGFPRPLNCPVGTRRRAISVRYFTAKVPKGERASPDQPHFRPQDLR